mmetsp:Transcript_35283/g.111508  ORF Transcript_35283/g.111508 Transcript_35283/m.111508 type:complete len:146 (+) Transcript_35283:214-651(+)|eukprot:CAMPEP_0182892030 /NCGR_PEP_ID=MMETSP0034_2-20130328/23616_1 /TAXON_ID=156128 /ORGANISM="Nephroselmis pyriformis, Strain CCMP717" /LENGTH=145 /DNA_ID=CAMNT_0025025673 /DNA_START=186 /DNA_END=623 /DNA_ORIENTATION=-
MSRSTRPDKNNLTSLGNVTNFRNQASAVGGSIDNMRKELQALDTDIKADKAGKAEYQEQINRLKRRKAVLEARVQANKDWAESFDGAIGPFENKYQTLVDEIHQLYGEAKEKHAEGLKLLMSDFQYHPAFKRWSDTFSASPFTPL